METIQIECANCGKDLTDNECDICAEQFEENDMIVCSETEDGGCIHYHKDCEQFENITCKVVKTIN